MATSQEQEAHQLMKMPQRQHVEAAIARINAGELGGFANSTTYDLLYEGPHHPPKRVVGLALLDLSANSLTPYDFKGGEASLNFKTLQRPLWRVPAARLTH